MFDSLDAGESISFRGTYKVVDVHGHVVSARIDIRVDGLNDGPTFTVLRGSATVVEAINAAAQNIAPIKGALVVSDKDVGDKLDAKVVGTPTLTYSGGALPAVRQSWRLECAERVEVDRRRL